ncbi:MAG: phenylacetic acid degradation protein PaaN [Gammaproteobacteria bacterium]|nr:phenylacetic acid degradation protein PaaN [Gammaproteobacteria bacterium]MCP5425672.1 phenylacetic acid degradation protein PaaN [Gammaproteobacteria bacterium]
MSENLFERHRATLDKALQVIHDRSYWSAYPEMPSGKIYGETANDDGKAAFEGYLNHSFAIDQPGSIGEVGQEESPFLGEPLGIRYPKADIDILIPAMQAAMPAWVKAGPDARAGACLEILHRLNKRSYEMAYTVMQTTGQAFMMAFQAGGPHAQDRGLEAVAYAYREMTATAPSGLWEKPQGKNPPLKMLKKFNIMPRGIGLVIGCCTFPTWNGYPGLFASLVTGNAVLVKPHPGAILPLALTVRICREVLAEAGFDPNLVALAANDPGQHLASVLAMRPEVKIIDFTGSTANGDWLENNARHAQVYTEKAGVNTIVIDSADDFKAAARNIAFSLSLYSGQMCTAPQDIFVPRGGIQAGDQHLSFDEVATAIATGVSKFLSDPARAVEVLGAIQNESVQRRVEAAHDLGEVLLASQAITHPQFPKARVRTPVIVKLDAKDEKVYMHEHFGPIAFIIATDDTEHSIALAAKATREQGALTCSVYSSDEAVLTRMEEAAAEAGVALSVNLTGGVFVNQSAAFSDFHATGANPAANATLTDSAFVASRFRVIQSRRHTD